MRFCLLNHPTPWRLAATLSLWIIASVAPQAPAETPTQIDRLTRQWLETERQASHLQTDWLAQKPVLEQRLALLKAEKDQLQTILKESSASQDDVAARRAELLAQQAGLERQQQALAQSLALLLSRLDVISALLPPPLDSAWRNERSALGKKPEPSVQLQVALAQLSSLADFDQRISVHETAIAIPDNNTTPGNTEILVKQLYLGVGMAWFASADGRYAGWGRADDDGWSWHVDNTIDAAEINKAIAIFEKRQQADFVRLPVRLAASIEAPGNEVTAP